MTRSTRTLRHKQSVIHDGDGNGDGDGESGAVLLVCDT